MGGRGSSKTEKRTGRTVLGVKGKSKSERRKTPKLGDSGEKSIFESRCAASWENTILGKCELGFRGTKTSEKTVISDDRRVHSGEQGRTCLRGGKNGVWGFRG